MPSVSGWALRQVGVTVTRKGRKVSMPSVSGWALRPGFVRKKRQPRRFYALGIGLNFATLAFTI